MKTERIQTDVTVIGGGLAGVCAAIAAARLGMRVALVHNRPVLGGNSSSEVRVWVCGATGHGINRYARETGIMGELFLENQYTNPEGNPYYWDAVVMEAVRREPGIALFLNTDVHELVDEPDGELRRIVSATGWMIGSERKITFTSPLFLDCTGDGLIGFLAGARYRIGREAVHEYNEDWAQEEADDIRLGSTLLFYTKDVGVPVKYVPPFFAKDIAQTEIPQNRIIRSGDSGCHYWWIEWGGEMDTVHDNERIRDELLSVIYGIWDFIKNSGRFEADHLTLEWVGYVPGKREYRRFIGDYVLTQNDIRDQSEFADRIAFGGWSIDLHDPKGMYGAAGSRHYQPDGIYHIPFRTLYSANVSNLLFAGRNISVTHVAFGSTRVQGTCAVLGEAAGTAAALCARKQVSPRTLYERHNEELQRLLFRQDASLFGAPPADKADLAAGAAVTASSSIRQLAVERADERYVLSADFGFIVPVDPSLERLELLMDVAAATTVRVEIHSTGKPQNYIPVHFQTGCDVRVEPGEKQWVTFQAEWHPDLPQNAFVIVRENPSAALHVSTRPFTGILAFVNEKRLNVGRGIEGLDPDQPAVKWNMKSMLRKTCCFRQFPETAAYSAEKVVDGYLRPFGGPHMWVSEPRAEWAEAAVMRNKRIGQPDGEWLQLAWPAPVRFNEMVLIFNDDVNEDLINLHHHRSPYEIMPELVRSFSVEIAADDGWKTICSESDNRRRKRMYTFPDTVETSLLRIVVTATNGCPRAEIVKVGVWHSEDGRTTDEVAGP